ncbi:hypothetical protein BGLA2_1960019 [Burkholderia gladioli]|nr:hypothetical protein BGLA2_1960019 [Burkholderia gladioli]
MPSSTKNVLSGHPCDAQPASNTEILTGPLARLAGCSNAAKMCMHGRAYPRQYTSGIIGSNQIFQSCSSAYRFARLGIQVLDAMADDMWTRLQALTPRNWTAPPSTAPLSRADIQKWQRRVDALTRALAHARPP